MKKLILASSSPRRQQLLQRMGLAFEMAPANADETPRRGERPDVLVRRLAATKAILVGEQRPDQVIVGADTVVALGRVIMGKPHDADHARTMLQMLSGNRHQIYTGIAVWSSRLGRGYVAVSVAHVTFRSLSSADIADYVATGEALDKAGAYAIQGGAGQWVESYEGNLETVIGLPRDVVQRLLVRMDGD